MIKEDLFFIQRFFHQVYSYIPTVDRRFKNSSDLADWIEDTIGPRESNNHFLYLTGDFNSPVEWVLITNWKHFYKQVIEQNKPMTQLTKERQQLLEHLLKEEYISSESQMSSFIKSISERFYRQLLDDMTYKNEEV